MLQMVNVCKKYKHRGQLVTALVDANLTIDKGEFIAVVGPSGSGKSTLLLMLGGMLSPTCGQILLDDQYIYDLSLKERAALRRQKIGFVFQTFNLIPYLTALENVELPRYLMNVDPYFQSTLAVNLLTRVGLADRLQHKPCELSVGQQQRVALARMLANCPAVVLADEPTGILYPETSQQIIDFLVELNQEGKTIVMVTHDPRAAARATRTLHLTEGKIT